jgi:hypothetical protein
MNLKRTALCCALALALVLSLCSCRFTDQTAESETEPKESVYMAPIDAYYTAFQNSDFTALQASMPASALDALGLDAGELSNSVSKYTAAYGSGFQVAVKESGSVQLDSEQLSDLSSYLKSEYGISTAPKDGYLVEYTAAFSGTETKTLTESCVVYRLKSVWYMDICADANIDSIRALYDNQG